MSKLKKTLGTPNSPYIISLMSLIRTQSKRTIITWCLDYCEENFLPMYGGYYTSDMRLNLAIMAARDWQAGKIKLPEAKKYILDVHEAARQAEDNPAAQAAARAVGQASSTIHSPGHSLGIAFYGAAARAYDRAGLDESPEIYDKIAAEECAAMENALRAIAVENEENPAQINWRF